MKLKSNSSLRTAFSRERGQVLPWMALMLMFFMGIAAFVVDIGRAVIAYHMLQASTDAAAMAGVAVMPTATSTTQVTNEATLYSAVPGNKNANALLLPNASMVSGYPKVYCSTTVQTRYDIPCNTALGGSGANAIVVEETATIHTLFAGIIGIPTMTVNAASTAAMKGAQNAAYNIAVVLDTTASMASSDGSKNCSGTKIQCAEDGVQTLLNNLTPCTSTSTSTSCTGFDSVSIFTYPNIQANTVNDDISCNPANPTNLPYSTPAPGGTWTNTDWTSTSPTYQITSYLSDWTQNNQKGGSFNNSSGLTVAAGAATGSGCPGAGMQAEGGEGTYYAGAIYAALSSLAARQAANPGSQNALIILSDGDANATSGHMTATNGQTLTTTGTYPSLLDQCHQAITAAQTARTMTDAQGNLDTTVYTIAYGASNSASSSCSTDKTGGEAISACDTLQQMASTSSDFFSDANNTCPAATNYGGINGDFVAIVSNFTQPRLISNGTP
jgi:hypothetical protein